MIRYIAFLRGINVSGQKLIKMEDLREYFKLPGFKNIVSYIQSGNILFDSAEVEEELLRLKIEKRLLQKTGFNVTVILRTLDDMAAIVSNNPFGDKNIAAPRKLYVTFLERSPEKKLRELIESFSNEKEEIRLIGREAYLLTGGYADTRFSNNFLEKKSGMSATTRNWATLDKILEL